jgi:exonuclease VII small subunit
MNEKDKKTTLKKVEGGKNTQQKKPTTTAQAKTTTKPLTVPELQKQIETLRKQIEQQPQSLEDKIKFFERKKVLIKKLKTLENHLAVIDQHLDKIAETAANNDFFSEDHTLTIASKDGYRDSEAFKFRNPLIIGEILVFLKERITFKMGELHKAIEA